MEEKLIDQLFILLGKYTWTGYLVSALGTVFSTFKIIQEYYKTKSMKLVNEKTELENKELKLKLEKYEI